MSALPDFAQPDLALTFYALTGAALIGLGTYGLIVVRHLLRQVIAFNLMGSGLFLFFGAIAARGGTSDPVPHALIITGIVVALSASALAVGLIVAQAESTRKAAHSDDDDGDDSDDEGPP
jgi:multicomponent Na+:H+ antiporter subunit C